MDPYVIPSTYEEQVAWEQDGLRNGPLGATESADWHVPGVKDRPDSSWAPVNLEPILEGGTDDPPPSILTRTDGQALFYTSRVHVIAGEPESGKGWLVCRAVVDELHAHQHVVYIDFETTASEIVSRLVSLGARVDEVVEFFHYIRPDEPLGDVDPASIATGATLVIVDGTTEALATFGLKLESNTDQAAFLKMLARPMADAGAAVVLLDHVTKDRDRRGRWAIGSQHKLAGTDVTYMLDQKMPFGRGLSGVSRLTVSKDRPGYIRAASVSGKTAGDVRLSSDPDTGSVAVEIHPGVAASDFRPTFLMERISRYLEGQDEKPSRTGLLDAVQGHNDHKRRALECLIQEGYVGFEPGPRNSHFHFSIREYRDE
jgi:AAA domain